MVAPEDIKELFVVMTLIVGFSVTGFFIDQKKPLPKGPISLIVESVPSSVPLVANPVVHISVPAHNIFAPN